MNNKSGYKLPLLIDLDGVIRIEDKPAPDVQNFIDFLEREKIPACILSNSSKNTASHIRSFFDLKGVNLHHFPMITALEATINYVKSHYRTVSVFCEEKVKKLFGDLERSNNPEAVVIGDLGSEWTFETLNKIFTKLMAGADLVAMQKNRFYKKTGEGLVLDVGAFVSALEFAASKRAILIGKPGKILFEMALKTVGQSPKSDFIMLGDDLDSDIYAAQHQGGKGILIMTGKTTPEILEYSKIIPDYIVNNLTEVEQIYKEAERERI